MKSIVLLGAGSAAFTSGLLADLISEGSEWDIRLVDIDPSNLDVAFLLGKRMIESQGASISLSRTLDRCEAIAGADVVVATIAVGGRRAWEKDVFYPRKYGIFQPVGDTIMPGGIFRALRMIPTMVEIAKDMGEIAPDAHFFNYSNPMAAICRGIRKAADVPVIGLCHGIPGTQRYLADFLGVDIGRCEFNWVGINHLTWIFEFRVDHTDAWPQVRKRCEALEAEGNPYGGDEQNPFSWELFRIFGAFPAVLDRHVTEFFPQFFRSGNHYGERLGVSRFSFEKTIQGGDESFRRMADQAYEKSALDQTLFNRAEGEHEQLVDILRALDRKEATNFSVIVPNTGQVNNLPRDFVLECPAQISSRGIHPLEIGTIPTGLSATVEKALYIIELTVEAALERDRKKLLQAIIMDGSVSSIQAAERLTDEMIEIHKDYLDGW
jgi:alpha-galactosidase